MTPSHARKRGIKYRYYISSALLQGRPKQAGTVNRIAAPEVEALVIKAVRNYLDESTEIADALLIQDHVVRVEVQSDRLVIELTNEKRIGSRRKRKSHNVIEVPWRKTPSTRRREILTNPDHIKTSALSVPRAAHSWSQRLHGGDVGLMNS
jgi:site-specific DNA recombinase